MIKQGGQNIGFMFNTPQYKQCITCRNMALTCWVQSMLPMTGLLKDGTCSGYRWSFIKWIKDKIFTYRLEHYLDKIFKRKPSSLHTKSFHIRNIMGNELNKFIENEYEFLRDRIKK